MAVFRLKLHFSERKSATKFLCVKTVSDKVLAFIGLSVRAKMVGGDVPFYARIWSTAYAHFQSIFARSASAITPSEKSSINTNVHYDLFNEFNMNSVRYPEAPKEGKGAQKCKVAGFRPKFEEWSAITSKRYERDCRLVLTTIGKSHTYGLSIGTDISDLEWPWTA